MINPKRKTNRILDAKYKKEDLNNVITEQHQHLSTEECEKVYFCWVNMNISLMVC